MVILSVMASMIVTAVKGVTLSARESRTKHIIAAIDSVLLEKYQSYKYRAFAVEIPDTFNPANLGATAGLTEIGFEVLATEAARVRLQMVRDMQRMEMPDRLSDISSAPMLIRGAANPVLRDGTTSVIRDTRSENTERRMFKVSWFDDAATFITGGDNVPSKLASYRDRIPTGFNFTAANSVQNQGAECLYFIMATSFVGGSPAIDVIPQTNIGDTDGDGLQEILDGWGQPLGFIRWPVGYFDPEQSVDTTLPDDFDLFRSDFSYYVDPATSTVAIPTDVNASPAANAAPWSMRPLVFSLGADGAAGFAVNPWTTAGVEQTGFSYRSSSWLWPTNVNHYGTELGGRTRGTGATTYTNQSFIDPYLRKFVAANQTSGDFSGVLPGQLLTATAAAATDNITNYALQAATR